MLIYYLYYIYWLILIAQLITYYYLFYNYNTNWITIIVIVIKYYTYYNNIIIHSHPHLHHHSSHSVWSIVTWPLQDVVPGILNMILFHFEALLHNNILSLQTPPLIAQYIAQYYQLLHPPPSFEVFWGVCRCFLVGCRMGRGVWKKIRSRHEKKGHYCTTLLCNTPHPAPLYCLQYCAIYFPHDPLYCNKILPISCR